MNRISLCTMLVLGAMVASTALGRGPGQSAPAALVKPINAMCPIGKEPIVVSAGTVQYKGHAIGLCCPSCGKAFLAWDEPRRDHFVSLATLGKEPGRETHGEPSQPATSRPATSQPAASVSYPYPLDTCIVSGEKLGSMGKPVAVEHEGRRITLCCRGCLREFEAEPKQFIDKLDAKIIETQMMHYPIDTCIVAGGKLGAMGAPVNLVHGNRLVRFCCARCEPTFKADPAKFFAALDKKIAERQVEAYPLQTCVVSGQELGSMGEPVSYTYNNRLVRFCCGGCVKTFEADPAAHMDRIDTAHADAQREDYPVDTCVVSGQELGSMGEPYEIVAGNRLVRLCCKGCLRQFQKDPSASLTKLEKP